jgi:hypothetical protein
MRDVRGATTAREWQLVIAGAPCPRGDGECLLTVRHGGTHWCLLFPGSRSPRGHGLVLIGQGPVPWVGPHSLDSGSHGARTTIQGKSWCSGFVSKASLFLRLNHHIHGTDRFPLTARKRTRERPRQHRRTPFTSLAIPPSPPPHCRFRLDSPSPPFHWPLRLMAGIAHVEMASRSSPPSPVSVPCFSSRSSFACTSWHRHRIPESVDELTSLYNCRNHSIIRRPNSIEMTFPIGRSLRFE